MVSVVVAFLAVAPCLVLAQCCVLPLLEPSAVVHQHPHLLVSDFVLLRFLHLCSSRPCFPDVEAVLADPSCLLYPGVPFHVVLLVPSCLAASSSFVVAGIALVVPDASCFVCSSWVSAAHQILLCLAPSSSFVVPFECASAFGSAYLGMVLHRPCHPS